MDGAVPSPPRTTRQTVLLAVATLAQPAHRTDIAMAAWQRAPASFSLGTHPHPNSAAVYGKLSELVTDRLVEFVDGGYTVTRRGLAVLRELTKPPPVALRPKAPSAAVAVEAPKVKGPRTKIPPPVSTLLPKATNVCTVTRDGASDIWALSRTAAFARYLARQPITEGEIATWWSAAGRNRRDVVGFLRCAVHAKNAPLSQATRARLYQFHRWVVSAWGTASATHAADSSLAKTAS